MRKENKISKIFIARKPFGFQQTFYCAYCKTKLMYLYYKKENEDDLKILVGIGLDRHLWCPKCAKQFKIGTSGFSETIIYGVKIVNEELLKEINPKDKMLKKER